MALANSAQELFDEKVPKVLAEKKPRVGMVYLFKITGPGGGEWTLDLVSPEPRCIKGDTGESRCTVEVSYEDFKQILLQPFAATQLYFRGKLKVVGDVQAVLKLQPVFQMLA